METQQKFCSEFCSLIQIYFLHVSNLIQKQRFPYLSWISSKKDVWNVGCSSPQGPSLLHFVGWVVGHDRSGWTVKILRWWWKARSTIRLAWSTIRLAWSTNLMSDDLLCLTLAAATGHFKDVGVRRCLTGVK